MNRGWRWRPSVGFVLVCIVHLFVVAFFVWGFSTPPLDRAWTLHHQMKTGERERLDTDDRTILSQAMARHPRLARALVGKGRIGIVSRHMNGWVETRVVTVIRSPRSGPTDEIVFNVQTHMDLMPYIISINGPGFHRQLRIERHGQYPIKLNPTTGGAEIIEISFTGDRFESDPSVIGTRIGFGKSND